MVGKPFIFTYLLKFFVLSSNVHIKDEQTNKNKNFINIFSMVKQTTTILFRFVSYIILDIPKLHVLTPMNSMYITVHQKKLHFSLVFQDILKQILYQIRSNKKLIEEIFYARIHACNFGIAAALLQSHQGTNKKILISTSSKLITQAELRLSTLMRKCTKFIYIS